MSQRNPMNERYTREDRTGVSRKSAASAKPKTKAASTVTMGTTKKSMKQRAAENKQARKEAQKKERERQREIDRKYSTPDTQRYKKLRRTWWIALAGAIVCIVVAWPLRTVEPTWMAMVVLFLAYALVIFAFYLDFSPIKKERRAYQKRMLDLEAEEEKAKKKEAQAHSKKQKQLKPRGSGVNASRNPKTQAKNAADKAEGSDVDANEELAESTESTAEKPQKRGLFGRKKTDGAKAADASVNDESETVTEKA